MTNEVIETVNFDDFIESIKDLLTYEENSQVVRYVNLINSFDNAFMSPQKKIQLVDDFLHVTGTQEEINNKREFLLNSLAGMSSCYSSGSKGI